MGRAPCCDKANVKKGPWSPDEDAKLKSYIQKHGTAGNWIALPPKIGLKRCGKSCRLRWLNYLRPNLKHGALTPKKKKELFAASMWSIIAAQLPGRTDNDIKNYWNTRLKKKLLGKQRKAHVQHPRRGESTTNDDEPSSLVAAAVAHGANNNQPPELNPYSLDLPVSFNVDHQTTPIRKLLIKLGGRSSEPNDGMNTNLTQFPAVFNDLDFSSSAGGQIYYEQSIYSSSSSTSAMECFGCGNGGIGLQMLQGQSCGLAGESRLMEEMVNANYSNGEEMAGNCLICPSDFGGGQPQGILLRDYGFDFDDEFRFSGA